MNLLQAFLDEQIKPIGLSCVDCTCLMPDGKKKKCCKKYKRGKRCNSCPKG